MVTMHWTKDEQGRLVTAWADSEAAAVDVKITRSYHKAVHPIFKTRRSLRRRLLRTLSLAAIVN